MVVVSFQRFWEYFRLLLVFFIGDYCSVSILIKNIHMTFAFFQKVLLVGDVFEVLIQQRIWTEVSVLVVKILGYVCRFENFQVLRRSSVYPLETWTQRYSSNPLGCFSFDESGISVSAVFLKHPRVVIGNHFRRSWPVEVLVEPCKIVHLFNLHEVRYLRGSHFLKLSPSDS